MEILGYILAILIGLSLGLIGSGGSILTVPLLVYFFAVPATVATSYSLFIVGMGSAVGAFSHYRKGQVDQRIALLFGLTSVITVYLIRKFVIPYLPDELFRIGNYPISKSLMLMVCFATLMLLSALFVLTNRRPEKKREAPKVAMGVLFACGIGIGMITGFLGAGGGFLIVPLLILLFHLPIKTAAGTSLTIIATNTLLGMLGDVGHFQWNWTLVIAVLAITIIGLFIGMKISKHVDGKKLSKGFGWFLLGMAVIVIFQEIMGLIA